MSAILPFICVAVGFAAQFFIMRYVKGIWWRLSPTFFLIFLALYAIMRGCHIIEYPTDSNVFIPTGPLVGLVLLLYGGITAIGCLLGFIVDRIIVFVKKRKNKKKEIED